MSEVIQEYTQPVTTGQGSFRARACGEQRADGTWSGWLEFTSAAGALLATDQETSQPDREALTYWASGIEPIYLEGALERARGDGRPSYRVQSHLLTRRR